MRDSVKSADVKRVPQPRVLLTPEQGERIVKALGITDRNIGNLTLREIGGEIYTYLHLTHLTSRTPKPAQLGKALKRASKSATQISELIEALQGQEGKRRQLLENHFLELQSLRFTQREPIGLLDFNRLLVTLNTTFRDFLRDPGRWGRPPKNRLRGYIEGLAWIYRRAVGKWPARRACSEKGPAFRYFAACMEAVGIDTKSDYPTALVRDVCTSLAQAFGGEKPAAKHVS